MSSNTADFSFKTPSHMVQSPIMLDISVCILSYNRPAFLRDALLSVLSQTVQPKNIRIYDNGSEPDVRAAVSDLLEGGVEWVGAEKNGGANWNFHRAMRGDDSQFVMTLHDDDRLLPDFLETQVSLLQAYPALAAISCNGYYIDVFGNRTGATLRALDGEALRYLSCSGDIAMQYADNSCIPLSPAIYRRQLANAIAIREDFGKVCDAVYFCDLADNGGVAYQNRPLYECRIHGGQDSSSFPYDLLNTLEDFFWTCPCHTDAQQQRLHTLLLRQHASRNLRRAWHALRTGNFTSVMAAYQDPRFSALTAAVTLLSKLPSLVGRRLGK